MTLLAFLSKLPLSLSCPFLPLYRYNSLVSSFWAAWLLRGGYPTPGLSLLRTPKGGVPVLPKSLIHLPSLSALKDPMLSNCEMFPLRPIFSGSFLSCMSKFGMIFCLSSILQNLDDGLYMQPHALEDQFCSFSSPACCSCRQTHTAALSRALSRQVPVGGSRGLGTSARVNTVPVSLHAWCSPGPSCFLLLPCLCCCPSFPSRQWDS